MTAGGDGAGAFQRIPLSPDAQAAAEPARQLAPVGRPVKRRPPPTGLARAAHARLELPPALVGELHAFAAARDVSGFDVLLTAFVGVLARYTGQPELTLGTTVEHHDPGAAGAAGCLDDQVVLTVRTEGNPNFGELLRRVRTAIANGLRSSVSPADRSTERLQPARDASWPPLVSVAFQPARRPDQASDLRGVRTELPGLHPGTGHYELQVDAQLTADRAQLHVRYLRDLFDADSVTRLLGHFRTLLAGAIAYEHQLLSRLPLLTPAEQRLMLLDWNDTAADLDHGRCLHQHVAARAAADPDSTAVVQGNHQVSYREVDQRSRQLARQLAALGVRTGVRVGLCLERSPELLIAVLGVLQAGGAYVPLDVDYPADRLEFMLRDAGCAVLLTSTACVKRLPQPDIPVVCLDRDLESVAAWPVGHPPASAGPEDLCYVIYTSGSTGQPKGIALRHRGVTNNLLDLNSRFGVGPGDRVLALSSTSFDMSVYELLGTTMAGATVVLPDPDRAKEPAHWADLVSRHRVTVWNSAPALLELFIGHLEQHQGVRAADSIRLAMLGGDWIPLTLPDRLRNQAPRVSFIALGGATEASIHSTVYEVTATRPDWTSIPYGRPMANQRTYLLDPAMQPVPIGVPGELYLAGTGLAWGYLNRPELTTQRFVSWSHGPVRDERLYRTGDLARYGPDGLIELLGRMDFQVKIRGLRIELGEVEGVLRRHPDVAEAVVAARQDGTGDRTLVGYLVARSGTVDVRAVHAHAAERLPAFMVPAALVVLDRLPLSPNGKVDRRLLPDPPRPSESGAGEAPRGPSEQRVADAFSRVLDLQRVGRDDDFFALGGDSWKAILVVRAIGGQLGVAELFRNPTVRKLAELL
jgi:amino acid adenylation domain-containing protein